MKNYDINQEIQKYYKISMFFNKYIVILGSLVLSFILMLTFNIKDNKVLAYTSSDILNKTLYQDKEIVGKDFSVFNKNSKYIKAVLQFTKSKQNKIFSDLGIGIFSDKFGIYYPMTVKINNKNFVGIQTKQDVIKKYVNILKSSKKLNNKFIIPKLITKEDEKVIKEYNLGCMDTYLNNSIFCNINKNHLINDLINKKSFDISKQFYSKLFSNLDLSNKKKCIILSKIYSKKYNFLKIEKILEENACNIELYKKAYEFIKEIGPNSENLFTVGDNLPDDYDVLMQKLTQQFYMIVKQDTIPNYMIYANIKLLKDMINNNQMDSTIASLAIMVLDNLIKKESFKKKPDKEKLISVINNLKKGNELEKGLNSYISNSIKLSSSDSYIPINSDIHNISSISVREKLNYIFKQKYKKIFTVTKKIKYNDKEKTAYVEGFIKLSFKVNSTIKQIPVKISFNVKNIIGTKFDIYNLKFLDKKISNYVNKNNITFNPFSLIDLKEQLEDKLYAPLVNKDYGKYDISICDKIRNIDNSLTCSNDKVSVNLNSYNLSLVFKLDNDLNIKKLFVNNTKIQYDLKNLLKEKISIDLSKKIDELSNKYKGSSYKNIGIVENKIESYIQKIIEQKELKLSGLTASEKLELNKKFKKYLGTDIKLIRKFHDYYRVFFTLNGKVFWVLYDKNKNNIKAVSIYIPEKDRNFIFIKNVNITLADLDQEKLNNFVMDPLNFLKQIDEKKYNEYISFIKKNK